MVSGGEAVGLMYYAAMRVRGCGQWVRRCGVNVLVLSVSEECSVEMCQSAAGMILFINKSCTCQHVQELC